MKKDRALRNKTIVLDDEEQKRLRTKLKRLDSVVRVEDITKTTINQDLFEVVDYLPSQFVELLFVDPSYNLNKSFNNRHPYLTKFARLGRPRKCKNGNCRDLYAVISSIV